MVDEESLHAEGCSSTRAAAAWVVAVGTTFCAARRGEQGRFNAVSEFSLFVPNFSFVPSCEEKIRYVLNKTEPGKNSVAGAGPLGRSGQGQDCRPGRVGQWGRGRAKPGWG